VPWTGGRLGSLFGCPLLPFGLALVPSLRTRLHPMRFSHWIDCRRGKRTRVIGYISMGSTRSVRVENKTGRGDDLVPCLAAHCFPLASPLFLPCAPVCTPSLVTERERVALQRLGDVRSNGVPRLRRQRLVVTRHRYVSLPVPRARAREEKASLNRADP
jgi:hypothetical protein